MTKGPKDDIGDGERIANARVLQVLRESGDVASISRPVRHWIYPGANPISDDLRQRIRKLGFTELESDEKRLIIESETTATAETMDRAVITLAWLCDEFGCEYDGWETEVVDLDS